MADITTGAVVCAVGRSEVVIVRCMPVMGTGGRSAIASVCVTTAMDDRGQAGCMVIAIANKHRRSRH